jgi:hypothetical protein
MGSIREISTGRTRLLEPEHLIGRAPTCALCLDELYVSAQHALMRWTQERWELKDLGSRNGTFLDGTRLSAGEVYSVTVGSRLAFGKLVQQWELADESSPSVMVVPLDGREPVVIEGDLLALPSSEDPQVTIYRSEGSWVLEKADDSIAPITNQQTFEVAGSVWRFCCADNTSKTWLTHSPSMGVEVRHLQLSFSIPSDRGDTHLEMTWGGRAVDMGTRAHNSLLLALARRRLEDAAEGLPETSCGWMYQEDLSQEPGLEFPQLNSDVFRIRKQFAAAGVLDAANVIERRPRTRQLRIGTSRISIVQL